jgi:hypothetical protein
MRAEQQHTAVWERQAEKARRKGFDRRKALEDMAREGNQDAAGDLAREYPDPRTDLEKWGVR